MYQRIKNQFEVQLLAKAMKNVLPAAVIDKLDEAASILDTSYGAERNSKDMGGYILLFQTASEFATILPILSQEYHFDTDLYEYDDPIEGTCWNSRLYLISSDDALMMVYPAE